jgi:hypothetical protein
VKKGEKIRRGRREKKMVVENTTGVITQRI